MPGVSLARNQAVDKNERSYYFYIMSKGDQTRRAILDTALTEASRIGLGGLHIGGLARRVGLS